MWMLVEFSNEFSNVIIYFVKAGFHKQRGQVLSRVVRLYEVANILQGSVQTLKLS